MYQIKGDVESIQRAESQTEVLVDDGNNTMKMTMTAYDALFVRPSDDDDKDEDDDCGLCT